MISLESKLVCREGIYIRDWDDQTRPYNGPLADQTRPYNGPLADQDKVAEQYTKNHQCWTDLIHHKSCNPHHISLETSLHNLFKPLENPGGTQLSKFWDLILVLFFEGTQVQGLGFRIQGFLGRSYDCQLIPQQWKWFWYLTYFRRVFRVFFTPMGWLQMLIQLFHFGFWLLHLWR